MERSGAVTEQRKHPRAPLRLSARIRWQGPLGTQFEVTETIDVSREGVLLRSREDSDVRMSRAWIVFPFNSLDVSAVQPETPARVVRVERCGDGEYRVGLRLEPAHRASTSIPASGERRASQRVALCLPIFVRALGMPWAEETMTIDFSRGGARFETSRVYNVGEGVRAKIPWGEWQETGEVSGYVVRVEPAQEESARWGTFAELPRRSIPSPYDWLTMADVFHRNFFLNGPAGRLEALLWTTANPRPGFSALVCHPHPLFGGTMHNKVVYQAAKALHQSGAPVLRFNFRGAGQSEGVHDDGRGEREDVRAALDYLAAEFSGLPILLAGFSFGSSVGLRVGCRDARVEELIGLGLPVNNVDMSFLQTCGKPTLILQGGNDQFGAREKLEALYEALPQPKWLVVFDGADHFFSGALPKLGEAIESWVAERHDVPKANPAT